MLYFINASGDSADQYLADGITEEIATSLGRIARLRVVSPSAVRRAQRAIGADPSRLARSLGVRHLVEGSVRRSGPRARITARLLGPDARTAIWTDAYTRPTADLLALEEELANRVASGVVGTLLPDERRSLIAARADPVAHDHVMRGNFQLARRSVPSIRLAIAEYQAAVAADSDYAVAWSRLALGQALLYYWAGLFEAPSVEAESVLARGVRAADRALELDSTVADTWAALGYLRMYRDPVGMGGVLDAFRRAVLADPNSGEAHHQLGTGYMWHLDFDRARAEMLRALELEPGRLVTFDNLAETELSEGRYDETLRWSDSAIAMDPAHSYIYTPRAVAHALLGDTAAAMRDVATAARVGDSPARHHLRCVVLGLLRSAAVRDQCGADLATSRTAYDSAVVYASLGEVEPAVAALEAAARARTPFLLVETSRPYFDALRRDARFQRLVQSLRPAEASGP